MQMQVLVKRQAIPICFSKEFEALLLNEPTDHISLTHDIEVHVLKGLRILEELEDVHDVKHKDIIEDLIDRANRYQQMDSGFFNQWSINIAVDILDEVDLIVLSHGEDLNQLGLKQVTQGSVIVLLALASVMNISL